MELKDLKSTADAIRNGVAAAVVGQNETVELMLTTLVTGGHILLEGPPGTAKTLIAQAFARTLSLSFGRIQFTPDLLPGDILGVNLFNFQTSSFHLRQGPIFCDLLLADEINRTPPKTQAALLEAMQERQVTLDGETRPLSAHFLVVATENPIEQQGVYPLPEAQLDRFLFKHLLGYPSREEEVRIVAREDQGISDKALLDRVTPVVGHAGVAEMIATAQAVRLGGEVGAYVVDIVRATRESADISVGASPRAAAQIARAARARAALDGRDYVVPDDVKALALPALRHRIQVSPAAEIEGRTAEMAIKAVIDRITPPR